MSRTRKTDSPDGQPSAGRLSKSTATLLMLVCTLIMLPLVFPPFYCYFLAPFALVPMCVCILRRPMNFPHLFLYYLVGIAFFLPNLFWLAPVTWIGWVLLALYLGLYFPLFAFGLHRLTSGLRLPATLAVPLVWTAVEYARSTFLEGGFPWFMLGNCFAPSPLLIQIADLFGVWGVTFLIAMFNGLIVDVLRLPLRREGRFSPLLGRLIAINAVVITFTISYGLYRLGENATKPGPRIAVIQDNIPQRVKDNPDAAQKMWEDHFRMTLDAASADTPPDLIAWPETMVPGSMNRELLNMPDAAIAAIKDDEFRENVKVARENGRFCFDQLSKLSNHFQTPLLLGFSSLDPRTSRGDSSKQNRTLLMLPDEPENMLESYAKVHLVPFGEYIPFRGLPFVGKYMVHISPWGFDYSNIPGSQWTRFHLPVRYPRELPASQPATTRAHDIITTTTAVYTFATPICFEDAMPEPARKMTAPQFNPNGVPRKTDFLINVSNDGWFYSAELDQHLEAAQLRAVENRVPIARAVNTGNSGFIDSCGRIIKLVTDTEGNSIGAVGTAAVNLPLDPRVTLFSKIGDLLPIVCGILSVLAAAWTFVRPRRDR